jgi:hypothetical protein
MVLEAKNKACAIGSLIGLHSLKEGLPIMQRMRSRMEPKILERLEAGFIPLAILEVGQRNMLTKYPAKR